MISIPAGGAWLDGDLAHAPDSPALVLILRPGSKAPGRARELDLADALQKTGYATLVMNLLTNVEEARDADARFNLPRMTGRVLAIDEWIVHQPQLAGLAVGLVATGTACGAAIRGAAKSPERVGAIVCAAGRPDLAGAGPIAALRTPIRFAVGAADPRAAMLRAVFDRIVAPRDWQTIGGAGDDLLEPKPLTQLARLTAAWFERSLAPPSGQPDRGDTSPAGAAEP